MKKFVVGNWKMNCTLDEAKRLAEEIIENLEIVLKGPFGKNLEIILCPPFTSLFAVSQIIQSSNHPIIRLGAQNCHFLPCGAYTGEISPKMLADFCQYVILGHSERRKYFGEDDAAVNKKIKAALEYGLKPIICVGEWKKGDSTAGIFKQVEKAIKDLKNKELLSLIFAYEPVWAIGTGGQPEPSYANKIIKEIKETVGQPIPVLYGGSVDSSNISGFAKQEMIDGALVGGASIKAKEFLKIINKVKSQTQSSNDK